MTLARFRFAIALAAFLAWLGWLAVAVAQKGDPVLSRAQLVNATHVAYAEVSVGPDGLPLPAAKVTEAVRGELPAEVTVTNLPTALPSGASGFPGPGVYLLMLKRDGEKYSVAGLPRSPGYEAADPERPVIYAATAATQAQLAKLLGG
jgi:hypothetical protein